VAPASFLVFGVTRGSAERLPALDAALGTWASPAHAHATLWYADALPDPDPAALAAAMPSMAAAKTGAGTATLYDPVRIMDTTWVMCGGDTKEGSSLTPPQNEERSER
jgi:hypothetical protein